WLAKVSVFCKYRTTCSTDVLTLFQKNKIFCHDFIRIFVFNLWASLVFFLTCIAIMLGNLFRIKTSYWCKKQVWPAKISFSLLIISYCSHDKTSGSSKFL